MYLLLPITIQLPPSPARCKTWRSLHIEVYGIADLNYTSVGFGHTTAFFSLSSAVQFTA